MVIQRIVEAAEDIVINVALSIAGTEVIEGVHRLIAYEQRDVIFGLQLRQLRRQASEIGTDSGGFLPGWVAREVVAEQPFPVGFESVMNRVPVPVGDHGGAGSDMAECLQAQLARERGPLGEALSLGFQHEVVLTRLQ